MTITVKATELEDFDEVEVIEVLVTQGDEVEEGQSLVTLESDKAMMEFPSPKAGVIKSLKVKEGDKVKQGDALVELDPLDEKEEPESKKPGIEKKKNKLSAKNSDPSQGNAKKDSKHTEKSKTEFTRARNSQEKSPPNDLVVKATELEDFDEVEVIEVLVTQGDEVEEGQSLVTLESDKAMMEFPSPKAGVIKSLKVKEGDKVKQGDALVVISVAENEGTNDAASLYKADDNKLNYEEEAAEYDEPDAKDNGDTQEGDTSRRSRDSAYASPGIRKYARELGVDIEKVKGSADKGRVLKEDVQKYVKDRVKSSVAGTAIKLPDFARFGPIESSPMNNLRKVSARHLQHAWSAPHVTQFDEVDITDLEVARNKLKSQVEKDNAKLTILPFVIKALVKTLQDYPRFNSSLDLDASELILKKYFHVGIAVDTPKGLVVPVIRDADKKKIPELAKELLEVSQKARDGKLSAKDMQGGCITITSLGGIGGTHFTPIINFPEVAILGVSRAAKKPRYIDGELVERLILPLSLSYDHRAIDGAEAAYFITDLKHRLTDVWALLI